VGLILALFGALALGYEVFRVEHKRDSNQNVIGAERTFWIPPVVSGIALVSGLLLTAVSAQPKDE